MKTDRGYSIVLPCFDEEENIRFIYDELTAALSFADRPYEIIFINDHSNDNTLNEIQSITDHKVKYFSHDQNKGIFESWLTGVSNAKYDETILMDSDGQNPPKEILSLIDEKINSGATLVQGERSSIGRIRDNRYILSKSLNYLLSILFNDKGLDIKSGFIIADTYALLEILESMPKNLKYRHTFIKLQSKLLNYSVSCRETLFLSRHLGSSFISQLPIFLVIHAIFDILKYKVYAVKNSNITDLERFVSKITIDTAPREFSLKEKIIQFVFFSTFPLHKWKVTSRVKNIYYALRKSQFFTSEQLESYQVYKLKKLLRKSYNASRYYRKLFDELNLHPNDINSIQDLDKLPILNKVDITNNLFFNIVCSDHKKSDLYKINTSGSTGTPFSLYVNTEQLEIRMASTMRAWESCGWKFGDKQLRLWHQTIGMSKVEVLKERIDAFLNNRVFIPAFEINENNIHQIIKKIEKVNPTIIDGYAECLSLICKYAKKPLNLPNLRAVISSAQMVTDETRRDVLEFFGAKLFDKYGSREFSGIAYQYPHSKEYFVVSESYILREGKFDNNDMSKVLITDLNNYSVPMINYQVGDLAVFNTIERQKDNPIPYNNFQKLDKIEGRIQSVIKLSDGSLLPSAFFMHFMKDFDEHISIYQFVQRSNLNLELHIVPLHKWEPSVSNKIESEIRPFIHDTIFNIVIVDDIPLVRTGKRLAVRSEV